VLSVGKDQFSKRGGRLRSRFFLFLTKRSAFFALKSVVVIVFAIVFFGDCYLTRLSAGQAKVQLSHSGFASKKGKPVLPVSLFLIN